jgi:peptide/nickel transport system substrate-binding protein
MTFVVWLSLGPMMPFIQDTSFFLIGWASSDGDGSSMLDGVVHSKDDKKGYGRYNNGKYSNPEVDRLIE